MRGDSLEVNNGIKRVAEPGFEECASIDKVLWGEGVGACGAVSFEADDCGVNFFWQKGHVKNIILFCQSS